jgi:chemosensory pili system protein ChpB (putative protein-glutamate methylesterase)
VSGLSIGILVDSALKQQYLGNMVVQAGHKIGFAHVVRMNVLIPALEQDVDAWVVDISELDCVGNDHSQKAELSKVLDGLLEQTRVPVIVNDAAELLQGTPEYHDWVRRMLQRLERLNGDISLQVSVGSSEVWVLAASTGGPAAVKDFLTQLPAALNIAFVYVQHINDGQIETLVKMMSNAGSYPVSIARQGLVLGNNTITLITPDRSVNIHDNGTVVMSKKPWAGYYSPSIDQIAANVARVYRQRSGIIIFSGMGDDGAASCRLIKQQGGKVWVQTPSQSTIASMPEAALATGTVSFIGTPLELADALAASKRTPHLNRTE